MAVCYRFCAILAPVWLFALVFSGVNISTAWHDMVFGFARFIDNETVIVAVNFAHSDADFYVDCSPLAKIYTDDDVV